MSSFRNLLVLGLDGCSLELLMPWISAGKLPIFQYLLENGAYGKMNSTIPAVTSPALPTIYTGKNPGNTGIFSFLSADGSIVSSSKIHDKTLWQYLSDKKKKSIISNLRTTYPPEEINGVMICSLHAVHEKVEVKSWEHDGVSWVFPKELQQELSGWAIDHKRYLNDIMNKMIDGKPEAYQNLKRLVESRAFKFSELLHREAFDFGFHWIEHTDTLNHLNWGRKEIILKFYQEVIEPILSHFIETFSDWNILIISDHGAAVESRYLFYVNTWLKQNGFLKLKNPLLIKVLFPLILILRKVLSKTMISRFQKSLSIENTNTSMNDVVLPDRKHVILGCDWSKTIAYSDLSWGIRINKNVLRSDSEYETMRDEIISELPKLNHLFGSEIVQGVWKREDIYFGKYEEQIPDIIFLPGKACSPKRMIPNKVLKLIKRRSPIGGHQWCRDAMFIAHGPDIKRGMKLDNSELYDVMPTVLFMLGMKIPKELDGRVINEIFSDKSKYADRDIEYSDDSMKRTHKIRDLTESEESEMRKMLKGLRYID